MYVHIEIFAWLNMTFSPLLFSSSPKSLVTTIFGLRIKLVVYVDWVSVGNREILHHITCKNFFSPLNSEAVESPQSCPVLPLGYHVV